MLAEAGHVPITFDNLSTGWRAFARWGPLEEGDTRDRDALARVFRKHEIRSVMHFAASSLVGESTKRPLAYWDNNVTGGLRLLEACATFGVETFVLSSTAAVYGEPERIPIPLDAPVRPINPYGATKAALERAVADLARSSTTFGATSFRYFNAAGAHPEGGIGERHEPETHLIPNALSAAWNGRPVALFGDDYDTPDGTCVRDYVHVVDIVRAHVAALEHPPRPGTARCYNLGTGAGFSVREILEACGRVTGTRIDVRVEPRRPGDPPVLVAGDLGAAERDLGWTPTHLGAESIVADAWKWQAELERSRSGIEC
jgi:UDP-glucose-4-epimerase GalE